MDSVFGGHGVQLCTEVSPVASASVYVFLGQRSHSCPPVAFLYFPGAHSAHAPSATVVSGSWPTRHTHMARVELLPGASVLSGHCVHVAMPRSGLNVSGAHGAHLVALPPRTLGVLPCTHKQFSKEMLCTDAVLLLAGHAVHALVLYAGA